MNPNETKRDAICPHCLGTLPVDWIKRSWAQYTSSLRRTRAGGRPLGWRKPAELDLDSETKPWDNNPPVPEVRESEDLAA